MLKGGREVVVQTRSYLPVIWSKSHSVRSHLPQANTTGVERNSKFSRTWKNKHFLEKLWREAASSEVFLASKNPSRKLILESRKFQTQDMNKIKNCKSRKEQLKWHLCEPSSSSLPFGWTDACNGWMEAWKSLLLDVLQSILSLSEEATSCVTESEDGKEDCFGLDGNDDRHTHARSKKHPAATTEQTQTQLSYDCEMKMRRKRRRR